jgi:hypothetical protein
MQMTRLCCDGDDSGGGWEGHEVGVGDGKAHLLHLRQHIDQQPPCIVAVDPQQQALIRQPCLDLRQATIAATARRSLFVGHAAQLLDEHRGLDRTAGVVLLDGLDLILQLPHVLYRVPKDGGLVHLQPKSSIYATQYEIIFWYLLIPLQKNQTKVY